MNLKAYTDSMWDQCVPPSTQVAKETLGVCIANFRDTILCLSLPGLIGRADNRVSYIDNRCLRDSYRVDLCKGHLQSTHLQPWFGVPSLSRCCGSCRLRLPPLRGLGSVVSRLPWSHQGFFFCSPTRWAGSAALSSSNFIWVESKY